MATPTTTPKRTKSVTSRFNEEVYGKMLTEANDLGLSCSSFINFAIRFYFRKQEGR